MEVSLKDQLNKEKKRKKKKTQQQKTTIKTETNKQNPKKPIHTYTWRICCWCSCTPI